MLVFTRRRDEAIIVRVHRREISDQIREANRSAPVKPDKLEAATAPFEKGALKLVGGKWLVVSGRGREEGPTRVVLFRDGRS